MVNEFFPLKLKSLYVGSTPKDKISTYQLTY